MTDRTEPNNPYAPPEAAIGPPPDDGPRNPKRAAEALRLRHLDDEAMVRSVALLFRIATVVLPLVAFGVGIALGRVAPWGPLQFALIAGSVAAPVLTGLIALFV
ncbi:MAG: hypothetical protein K2X91_02670 [Thermoleophilia bacterium]|nr:hypothetical protein [Thermoleophilia bacterium]